VIQLSRCGALEPPSGGGSSGVFRQLRDLWLPPVLFLLAFLGLKATPWFDPAVLLDDTRQFGAPLAIPLGDPAAWLSLPQIAYFQDVSPRPFTVLAQAVIGITGLPTAQALKVLALVLALATAALLVRLARSLAPVLNLHAGVLALFLVGNALCSTQLLSGTPRDLGSLLGVACLLCWLEQRWIALALALFLLAGCYPAYALVLLSALWLLHGLRLWRARSFQIGSWWVVVSLTLLTALGLKVLGPHLDVHRWGEPFRLFGSQAQSAVLGRLELISPRSPAAAGGLAWSELLESQRFRPWPGSGRLLRSIPVWLLLLAGLVVDRVQRLKRPTSRQVEGPLVHDSLACPSGQLLLLLAVSGAFWYALSFVLAFELHSPSRYLMLPMLLLLAVAESSVLQLGIGLLPGSRWRLMLVALVAILLGIGSRPQGQVSFPLSQVSRLREVLSSQVRRNPSSSLSPLLAVVGASEERRSQDLASSLPLLAGVPVLYAPELDRAFHLNAVKQNSRLLALQARLDHAVMRGGPLPLAALAEQRVTHLLGLGKVKQQEYEALRRCGVSVESDAVPNPKLRSWWLVDLQCLDRSG